MSEYYIKESENEYGTPISVFKCFSCGSEFTICPAVSEDKRAAYANDGCGDGFECDSYIPSKDVGVSFGDYSMFNAYCERNNIDKEMLSGQLIKGRVIRESSYE